MGVLKAKACKNIQLKTFAWVESEFINHISLKVAYYESDCIVYMAMTIPNAHF